MKAQKNTNSEAVKQFLLLAPRTRKEIVKFIAVTLNGISTEEDFDKDYKTTLRGYYSTFFRDVRHKGNIEKIGKKYQVTKSCLDEGNGLWSMNKDRKIEILENRQKNMSDQWQEIRHLNREIKRLRYLEEENDELLAEKKALEESVLMYSGQAKRFYTKLKDNDNEININIHLDITKK